METLLQWSLPAQDLLLPSGAVLMTKILLHVSCASYIHVHECNNNIDNYYSFLMNLRVNRLL